MPLMKSLSRINSEGLLTVPAHVLKMAGAKPGQLVEFVLGPRGSIQVLLKHPKSPGKPKLRSILRRT